jgi:aubergine-like protein
MFKRNARDAAACRLIRLACDIFGPRGDEKSGCRDSWLAYLDKEASVFLSFKSNRFNNFFHGAAAVVHHRTHMTEYLSNFCDQPNLKQLSVLKDAQCDNIFLMVVAIAALYVSITGPFWVMINSDVHYLDLHKHVQRMKRYLQDATNNPDHLLEMLQNLPSCLDGFMLEETSMILCERLPEICRTVKICAPFFRACVRAC